MHYKKYPILLPDNTRNGTVIFRITNTHVQHKCKNNDIRFVISFNNQNINLLTQNNGITPVSE
jgi:hypothetical protein